MSDGVGTTTTATGAGSGGFGDAGLGQRQDEPIQADPKPDPGRRPPTEHLDEAVVAAAAAERLLLPLTADDVVLERGPRVVVEPANEAGFQPVRDPERVEEVAMDRSGTWFDPELVKVVKALRKDHLLWARTGAEDPRPYVLRMEPGAALPATPERIDSLCRAFAHVIDAKSPFTFNHSVGVAEAAVKIAQGMALAEPTIQLVRRAALLHDIGKLSVSNAILEKPGKLNEEEWRIMRLHPVYTRVVLKAISGFENLAFVAAAHHERLDGTGYPDRMRGDQLPLTARIIAVADVYQALAEKRPYREALPHEVVMNIIDKEAGTKLDGSCLDVLRAEQSRCSRNRTKVHGCRGLGSCWATPPAPPAAAHALGISLLSRTGVAPVLTSPNTLKTRCRLRRRSRRRRSRLHHRRSLIH